MTGIHGATAIASLALIVLASACTGSTPSATPTPPVHSSIPTAIESPTPSPSPSPVTSTSASFDLLPVPQPADFVSPIACTGSIGASDPVAIVQLHAAQFGTGPFVLRDYANPSAPRTACTIAGGYGVVRQLIDARHMVIAGSQGSLAVVDLPELRYHWFRLPSKPDEQGASFVAVSPGLDEIAWLSSNMDGTVRQVHLTTASGDRAVASLRPVGGRCGSPEDSNQGAYARSGTSLYILDQPQMPDNTLLVVQGSSVAFSLVPPAGGWPASQFPGMAVWSPISDTLFYRRGSDVWKWTAKSGAQRYLAGVSWYYPSITPDGTHLAYVVRRPDGLHDLYLVDLTRAGTPQRIGEGTRNGPVFLNNTQLWYLTDSAGGCTGGATPKPLIYNLSDASEAASVIDSVGYVWPATSSNH